MPNQSQDFWRPASQAIDMLARETLAKRERTREELLRRRQAKLSMLGRELKNPDITPEYQTELRRAEAATATGQPYFLPPGGAPQRIERFQIEPELDQAFGGYLARLLPQNMYPGGATKSELFGAMGTANKLIQAKRLGDQTLYNALLRQAGIESTAEQRKLDRSSREKEGALNRTAAQRRAETAAATRAGATPERKQKDRLDALRMLRSSYEGQYVVSGRNPDTGEVTYEKVGGEPEMLRQIDEDIARIQGYELPEKLEENPPAEEPGMPAEVDPYLQSALEMMAQRGNPAARQVLKNRGILPRMMMQPAQQENDPLGLRGYVK